MKELSALVAIGLILWLVTGHAVTLFVFLSGIVVGLIFWLVVGWRVLRRGEAS